MVSTSVSDRTTTVPAAGTFPSGSPRTICTAETPSATAPAQNAGTAGALVATQGVGASTAQKGAFWSFPTRMIRAPSLTLFNPSAANAQVRNLDTNSDCSASAADIVSEWGASFNMTTPAGSAAGQRLAVQLVADARL